MSAKLAEAIEETREFLAEELPVFTREMVDTARAEGTTAAMAKVYEQMLKSVPGLAVVEKKDPYANLPTINFTIGPGMQIQASVTPAIDADVEDVEAKPVPELGTNGPEPEPLPEDPLELLALDFTSAVPVGADD